MSGVALEIELYSSLSVKCKALERKACVWYLLFFHVSFQKL